MERNVNYSARSTRAAVGLMLLLAILEKKVLGQEAYRVCESSLTPVSAAVNVAPWCVDSNVCPASSTCISKTEPVEDTCIDYCTATGDSLVSVFYTPGSSYQPCDDANGCGSGCCAMPDSTVVLATPAGTCAGNCDCNPSMLGGICVSGTDAPLPGYSCSNTNPCDAMETWLYQRCGYSDVENWQTFLPTRRCTQACARAMSKLKDCPNLAAFFQVADATASQCEGCVNYQYQTCQTSEECPSGYCCGLPPAGSVVACGPPSSCSCDDDAGVTCTGDCGPSTLGVCHEIGAVNPFDPTYRCACSGPAPPTSSPSAEPTFAPVVTSVPSGFPSAIETPAPSNVTSNETLAITNAPSAETTVLLNATSVTPSAETVAPSTVVSPSVETDGPTNVPSSAPSAGTAEPSNVPSGTPSAETAPPSNHPTAAVTVGAQVVEETPSQEPTSLPAVESPQPSVEGSETPSDQPSYFPTTSSPSTSNTQPPFPSMEPSPQLTMAFNASDAPSSSVSPSSMAFNSSHAPSSSVSPSMAPSLTPTTPSRTGADSKLIAGSGCMKSLQTSGFIGFLVALLTWSIAL